MGKKTPYKKRVSWLFSVEGEQFEITEFSDSYVEFEETTRNGYADTHMYGVARKVGSNWVIDEGKEQISTYGYPDLVPEIEMYFNDNGMPDTGKE